MARGNLQIGGETDSLFSYDAFDVNLVNTKSDLGEISHSESSSSKSHHKLLVYCNARPRAVVLVFASAQLRTGRKRERR